jgi:hypothetical protein
MGDNTQNTTEIEDITAILAENQRLLAENSALLREIELLEIALSEPKQRRRRRDEED